MFANRFIKNTRHFSTAQIPVSAMKVFQNSCYHKIDFKINEESSVKEAIMRFTAFNIGCLAVTDSKNKVVGVCSGLDYIT
jgi:predicted transcriptional regulator